jgi:hypothetical protein
MGEMRVISLFVAGSNPALGTRPSFEETFVRSYLLTRLFSVQSIENMNSDGQGKEEPRG